VSLGSTAEKVRQGADTGGAGPSAYHERDDSTVKCSEEGATGRGTSKRRPLPADFSLAGSKGG
jgi:hypothetical protein